jgi:hypothetical protein
MRRASLTAFLALMSGCSNAKHQQAAPAAQPPPPAAATPSTPAVPAGPPSSAAVMFLEGSHAIVTACYDARRAALLAGEDCIALIPPGSNVQTNLGTILRLGPVSPYTCEEDGGGPFPAFAIELPPGQSSAVPRAAVWPAHANVTWPREDRTRTIAAFDGAFRDQMLQEAEDPEAARTGLKLVQDLVMDMDIDGKSDHLSWIEFPAGIPGTYPPRRLYLVRSTSPTRLESLLFSERNRDDVLGAIDLDGDRTRELVMGMIAHDGWPGGVVYELDEDRTVVGTWWQCEPEPQTYQ